jgi:hypothetical protein
VAREPVHDWSSHPADAFRTAVEAINAGMVSDSPGAARALVSVVSEQARRAARRRPGELASAIPGMGW